VSSRQLKVKRWFRLELDRNEFAAPELQKNRYKKNYHVIGGKRNEAEQHSLMAQNWSAGPE